MPEYRLIFHRKAEKSLDKLEAKTKQRVLEDIQSLTNFTGQRCPLDIVKIQGFEDFYRLRSGRLRIEFALDKPSKTVVVLKIEQRERVYE